MFIDEAKIYVKAGEGGNGVIRFRREAYVPCGGPDGGDGGKGGDIVFEATSNLSTLIDFRYRHRFIVPPGEQGAGSRSSGRGSADCIIPLPVGTLIRDAETGEEVGDMTHAGQRLVAARGGRGGRGNHHFKSPTLQAPQIAEPGGAGEEHWFRLELKLLADIGLVGLPNAGKSTLLSTLSAARPKIANYPFTTLEPHLGVVTWGKGYGQHFTMADIPGLIEGAHEGRGLGTRFLKHLERTASLLHLVDISSVDCDPVADLKSIRAELSLHAGALAEKPFTVLATKIDVADTDAKMRLKRYCDRKNIPFFAISAATGAGIKPLLQALGPQIQAKRGEAIANATAQTARPVSADAGSIDPDPPQMQPQQGE
jgi:GTP-binding protein